jgi:D-threo-aldose 1-dehydrogenase
MRATTLAGTDVEVTELSFGAAGIGNLYRPVTNEAASAAVEAAWDAGVRTFDTAPHYGLGLSERRLGAALRGRDRGTYTVSTKVGRLLEPSPGGGRGDDLVHGFAVPHTHRRVWDFSSDGVLRSLEASLHRLGLDRVDIALLHDPDHHTEQALTEAYPALERLRGEGVVKAIGIASGVQRAADQLGGSTGITIYVGIGFAPALDGTDPFLVSSLLAVAGLAAAGLVAWRICLPATVTEETLG